jgi:hypothetical protein
MIAFLLMPDVKALILEIMTLPSSTLASALGLEPMCSS